MWEGDANDLLGFLETLTEFREVAPHLLASRGRQRGVIHRILLRLKLRQCRCLSTTGGGFLVRAAIDIAYR